MSNRHAKPIPVGLMPATPALTAPSSLARRARESSSILPYTAKARTLMARPTSSGAAGRVHTSTAAARARLAHRRRACAFQYFRLVEIIGWRRLLA